MPKEQYSPMKAASQSDRTFLRRPKPLLENLALARDLPVKTTRWRGCYNQPWGLMYHPEVECQLIKKGKCGYLIQGCTHMASRGSLLMIRPNQAHAFVPVPGVLVEKEVLFFRLALIERFRRFFCDQAPNHLRLLEKDFTFVMFILKRIQTEMRRREIYWQETVLLLLQEFALLVRRVSSGAGPPCEAPPILAQLIAFLEDHFRENLALPLLARKFGYSCNYLSMLLRGYTGVSIKQYILRRRIAEAKHLLETNPTMKVSNVADLAGFDNPVLFYRHFKAQLDLTPAAYRGIIH